MRNSQNNELLEKMGEITEELGNLRTDVSEILRTIQDELDAFRERQFWSDYRDNYHHE